MELIHAYAYVRMPWPKSQKFGVQKASMLVRCISVPGELYPDPQEWKLLG